MKKVLLVILVLCMATAVFSGCSKSEPISTSLGEFEYEQLFSKTLGEETAGEGNTYLIVYLTPAEGNEVTMDEAQEYFYSGVKARVGEVEFDMTFLAYEKVDGNFLRFGLVFEVVDNDYENAKKLPDVILILP